MSEKDKKLLNKLRVWVALRGETKLKCCRDYGTIPEECMEQQPGGHCPGRTLFCTSDLSDICYYTSDTYLFVKKGNKTYYCVEWVKGK